MHHLSHGVSLRARESTAYKIATYFSCLWLLVAGIVVTANVSVALAQAIESQHILIGGRYQLDRPSAMTVSPNGEKIAISDLSTNRIVIVDLEGRFLWTVGEQVRLEQPRSICFESDSRLLYTLANKTIIFAVNEYNTGVIDTVADLNGISDKFSIDQIVREPTGSYLILDRHAGCIYRFDQQWEFKEIVVRDGSGKGKLLAPAYMTAAAPGKLIVADQKNFPMQVFAIDGKFLYQGGWNQPSEQRGWEAAAVAVDTRGFVWVADDTNSQFRIFDQTGTQLSVLTFENSTISPVAMLGTIDNRMAVLEETGRLLFYTLQ